MDVREWRGRARGRRASSRNAGRAAFGGLLAAGLFVAVFPGNIQMAWDWRDRSRSEQGAAYGRLPLQGPMVWWALRVAKHARAR